MPHEHLLKVWPVFFRAIVSGDKPFEIRKDDRDFEEGNILILREWSPRFGYTGRIVRRRVSYLLEGVQWGLQPGYVCLGLMYAPPHLAGADWGH